MIMDSLIYGNSTTGANPENTALPEYAGYIGAAVAVIFFGSNFIPVKRFETGDGKLFSWQN